jgi:hypothetical protein
MYGGHCERTPRGHQGRTMRSNVNMIDCLVVEFTRQAELILNTVEGLLATA